MDDPAPAASAAGPPGAQSVNHSIGQRLEALVLVDIAGWSPARAAAAAGIKSERTVKRLQQKARDRGVDP